MIRVIVILKPGIYEVNYRRNEVQLYRTPLDQYGRITRQPLVRGMTLKGMLSPKLVNILMYPTC